ncbi:hypothetical protein [Undibacterium sp. GrIS 1.2]|uniref:hypothetical protein n=1 Tax=Undibacterium sp. GrIS 1.2 TaxID=3143933 RepID=UPI003394C098
MDPIEQSNDLRALFEKNRDSEDPAKLKLAYRAWRICVPNFIGPQSAWLAREMHERPDNDERRVAYRKLQDRCKNFSDFTDAQLATQSAYQKELWLTGKTKTPGEIATSLLATGDLDAALLAAKTVLDSHDLKGVESLRGFFSAYLRDQHNGDEELAAIDELRAAAYTVAACQMGLECGPNSIMAIEHCLYTGQCTGGIVERYLSALDQPSEKETLLAESKIIVERMQAHRK